MGFVNHQAFHGYISQFHKATRKRKQISFLQKSRCQSILKWLLLSELGIQCNFGLQYKLQSYGYAFIANTNQQKHRHSDLNSSDARPSGGCCTQELLSHKVTHPSRAIPVIRNPPCVKDRKGFKLCCFSLPFSCYPIDGCSGEAMEWVPKDRHLSNTALLLFQTSKGLFVMNKMKWNEYIHLLFCVQPNVLFQNLFCVACSVIALLF